MRKLAVILVGFGVFLIVLAPMARWYAYPKLAKAPKSQDSVTTLVGPNATIFDVGTLKEIQTDLTTKVRTVGDVKAAEDVGGNTVVWVSTSSTTSTDGVVRSREVEREAFNATSAKAVNCCGEFVSATEGENTPVKHQGLLVKFPFETQKKTYPFWDGTLGTSVPIKYRSTTKIDGVNVYKFSQSIPATKTGSQEAPASLLGLPGTGNVEADVMYANDRTLWVEPHTGVIIKRQEAQNSTLDYQGSPRLTTSKVTTGYDAKTVKDNASKYGSQGTMLHLVKSVLPWVSLVLGLLLVLLGLLLMRRQDQQAESTPVRGRRARVAA